MDAEQRAVELLKKEFGKDWLNIVQTLGTENLRRRAGKDLTSFVAYPQRGLGGSNQWRGNCTPKMVTDVIQYVLDCKRYYHKDTGGFTLLDPMSGSGTSKAAADQFKIRSMLYDLNPKPAHGKGGWNALRDDVEDDADLIFFHPPYHSMIAYSGAMWGKQPHPDDLSRCPDYPDFLEKLNYVIKKLYMALRKDGRLAILVGDIRKDGAFYSIQQDMMNIGTMEAFVVKGQYNCTSDNRTYSKPFIPIVTEYLVMLKKEGGLLVSFSRRMRGAINLEKTNHPSVTWNHLVRTIMESKGGKKSSAELYESLAEHPKAKANPHYKDRIRAVIQEHPDLYRFSGRGEYQLSYAVA